MNEITPDKALEIAAGISYGIGGEICAAIAMALDRCQEEDGNAHDSESFVITIKRTQTPWTSRYATLRSLPEKKK